MGGTCSSQGGQRGPFCGLKLELPLQMLIGVKGQGAEVTAEAIPLNSVGRWQKHDLGGLECWFSQNCS